MLSNEDIKKFQFLCEKHFGKKIDKEEALEIGHRLVNLMALIYKPIKNVQQHTADN